MVARDFKPDEHWVKTQREFLLDLWQAARTKWEIIDTIIDRTWQIWDPPYEKRPGFHPARANSVLDHANDNQMAFEPKVKRYPHSKSENSKLLADKIEPWVTSVFEEASLREPSLTFKTAGRNILKYGYTIVEGPLLSTFDKPLKPVQGSLDKQDFDDQMVWYKNEQRTWMPFRIRAPHPSSVLLDPLEKKSTSGIVHRYRFAHELESMQETRREREGHKGEVGTWVVPSDPFEPIMADEVFTQMWHGMWTEGGDLIFLEPNRFGFTPYGQAFSGFGGEVTDQPKGFNPAHLAVGLLDDVIESLKAHARAHSALHNAMIEAAFPDKATSGSAYDLEAQNRGDNIKEVPKGKDSVWYMQTPALPQDIFNQIALIEQDIEMGTFSRSLAGVREQGIDTVGQQAILSTAAARKFVAPGKQIEHLATNVAANLLRVLDVIRMPITVQGNKLTHTDIEHDYSITVKFELVDPVIAMQERQTSMNEYAQGLLSKESYFGRVRLEDATGELRRLDEDVARMLPAVQQLRVREILREWGVLDAIEKMEEEAAAQALLEAGGPEAGGGAAGTETIPQPLTGSVPGQPRTGQALADLSLERPL